VGKKIMRVFEHKDYNHYYQAQLKKYYRKKKNVWVTKEEIIMIVKHIKKHLGNVESGICHGTRTGWEIQQFKKRLKCDVIGTEIAPNDIPDTIEWDFHNIKDEWLGKFDFIYSNSFDHSNKPKYCIGQWMTCLKPRGICYVTWMASLLKNPDPADCLFAELKEFRKMFNKNFVVVDEFKKYKGRIVLAIKHRGE
jgi:hypothetical protein